jgi:hypothetical protein
MLTENNWKHNIGFETALDCSYLSKEVAHDLLEQYASVGKMLNSMINKSSSFCNKQITDN